jgi:hypothetical protein
LVSADGVKVPDLSVALLPGEHTIGMELSQQQQPYYLGSYLFSSPFPGLVTFTAAPGHEYLAYIDFQGQPAPGYEEYSGWSWTGYIKDEATRARVGKTETLPLTAFPLVPYQGGGGYSAR